MTHMARGEMVGYRRVSTLDQNTTPVLEGIDLDRVFEDRICGEDKNRRQLEAMLQHVREGDTVICHSLVHLGRDLEDLRKLVTGMTGRGIRVQFVKENLVFTWKDPSMMNSLLSIMSAFAQFERELIRERQREGIALAKRSGIYRGRKRSLTSEAILELRKRIRNGEKKAKLAKEYGVTRMTIYNALEKAKSQVLEE
jgi:DNA invertase Pin-like site-specific DNA recombinase